MRTMLLALLLALPFSTVQALDPCSWNAQPEATVTAPASATGGSGTYYLEADPSEEGVGILVWIYEESNGIEGLQRGTNLAVDCEGPDGDTIVF